MPHKQSKPGYLSVTEVLSLSIPKPFLNFWYGKLGTAECERIKRESQEHGTFIHDQIERRFKGEVIDHPAVNAFWTQFVEKFNVKPLILEETYEDDELKLQGTLDAICEVNSVPMVCDWKTSNSLDLISLPLQLAAYAQLSQQEAWKGCAVRIDKKTNKIEVKFYEDLAPYWNQFKQHLAVAKYNKFGIEDMRG